ncbi:ABC transporter substrate-binding protein [Shewanella sp. UCD-KL12]|uniref:substrate-binding periplasmic protein n=1 Tax=Shewanella sp. UCD-KL12 TaxID=1917163 RepID=UPI0009F9DA55|nr:transporter substrate-binding domain-containing protein [Shewanella sp. UCD-KL12]
MKLRLLLIGLYLACFSIATFAEDIEVTLYADSNYPPYSYTERGELKGIYSQIIKLATSRMKGYKVNLVAVPWKRGLRLIENGEGFAIYPPYFHVEKRPYIWPYSMPILDERVIVMCREELFFRALRLNWPEDYYGLIIGINSGFHLGGEAFWQAVKDEKITVSEAKGNRENLLQLGLKRIDCYLNDRISILWELKQLKLAGEYDEGGKHAILMEGATVSIEQGFVGYTAMDDGKYPFKENFKKQLDMIIYDMRRTGEMQKIVNDFLR